MRITVLLLSCLLSLCALAQKADSNIVYFNKHWQVCDKNDAAYFRHSYKKDSLWLVTDYYITNTVQMKGAFLDDSLKVKQGLFTYYHENGQKRSEVNFRNGKEEGPYTAWFDNMQKSSEGNYTAGSRTGKWTYWHSNAALRGEGDMVDDKEDGHWIWYFKSGKVSADETYAHGRLEKGKFFLENGKVNKKVREPEQMPAFDGGNEQMVKYLSRNINYPAKARENGTEGRVLLSFVISPEGEIREVEVIKGVTPEINGEALRVVRLMPKWAPGYLHGQAISVKYTLPIAFRLD